VNFNGFVRYEGLKPKRQKRPKRHMSFKIPPYSEEWLHTLHRTRSTYTCDYCIEHRRHQRRSYGKFIHEYLKHHPLLGERSQTNGTNNN